MVPVLSLWLPLVLSAVAVFIISSIVHMVLPFHKNDFQKLPDEDAVMNALRPLNIPRGEYMMPRGEGMESMRSEAFKAKWKAGPVGLLSILPNENMGMGPQLLGWFVYCLVISLFAAYLPSRALGAGAPFIQVFRFASVTAFLGYGAALWQSTIWYRHSVATTLKQTFDALLFAVATGFVFGWLWPS